MTKLPFWFEWAVNHFNRIICALWLVLCFGMPAACAAKNATPAAPAAGPAYVAEYAPIPAAHIIAPPASAHSRPHARPRRASGVVVTVSRSHDPAGVVGPVYYTGIASGYLLPMAPRRAPHPYRVTALNAVEKRKNKDEKSQTVQRLRR